MIRVMMLAPASGEFQQGGRELIETWFEQKRKLEASQKSAEALPLIWADFSGEDPESEARDFADLFDLHENAIEDAQRYRHPPKFENFKNFVFLLLKGLDRKGDEFGTIQIAFFLSRSFLVTRHTEKSASLDWLWRELARDHEPFREGTAKLFTMATRRIVDRYLEVLLKLENRLEELEEQMRDKPDDEVLMELSGYKSDLKRVTRIFAYHDRIFGQLKLYTNELFQGDLLHDVNDVYDRMERATSLATLYHDLAADLMESYISIASHRLNGIMKVLTIITAIFVPLSFIAGLYGMNFEYMPELGFQYAYFMVLGVMTAVVGLLVYIFKRKNWM